MRWAALEGDGSAPLPGGKKTVFRLYTAGIDSSSFPPPPLGVVRIKWRLNSPGTVPAASTGGVKAPYASGRDWAKIDKALSAEAEEKKVVAHL